MSILTTKAAVEQSLDEAQTRLSASYEFSPDDPTVSESLRAQAYATMALAQAVMYVGERIELQLTDIATQLTAIRQEMAG